MLVYFFLFEYVHDHPENCRFTKNTASNTLYLSFADFGRMFDSFSSNLCGNCKANLRNWLKKSHLIKYNEHKGITFKPIHNGKIIKIPSESREVGESDIYYHRYYF